MLVSGVSQVNRSLYGADDSCESLIRYLEHIDEQVQDGLFQLLLRSLSFLSDNMKPQVRTPGDRMSLQGPSRGRCAPHNTAGNLNQTL